MVKARNFSFFSAPLLVMILASSEMFAQAPNQAASEKAAKQNNKKVENKKKVQDNYDGFFNLIGDNLVEDIFAKSIDANINKADIQAKRLGKFAEWMSDLFKLRWQINYELRGLNTASKSPFTSAPGNEQPSYSASFEINLDPGKHILGLPSYFMALNHLGYQELIKQNDLYHDILSALCEYFVNKEKLRIHKQALVQFREHYEGAKARFKNGVINQIGLRQAEQNYASMQAKYAQSLAQVQSSKENLLKYSPQLDLNAIEKTKISFENINFDEYLAGIGEPLAIREAKAALRATRANSLANVVSCVTPNIVIRGENLFQQPGTSNEFRPLSGADDTAWSSKQTLGKDDVKHYGTWKDVPSDGGKILVSLVFDLAPTNVLTFIRAVDVNKYSSLSLVKVARETDIAIKNMKIELELQKDTVKMYRNAADLKKTIAELVRKKDIRDAEKHYNELLRADSEVAKAYEETQNQIFSLMKIALKLIRTAGGFVPSDLGKINNLINSKSDMKAINDEANKILNGSDQRKDRDQKDSKVINKRRSPEKSDNKKSNSKENVSNNKQSNKRVRTLSKIKP